MKKLKKISKKTDGTDILKEMEEKELEAFVIAKDGLEDLSLFLAEMEKIYKRLMSEDLSEEEEKFLRYRLKVIESYIEKLNKLINTVMHVDKKDITLN